MNLNLENLGLAPMGLTEEIGNYCLQACTVCLDNYNHNSGITYKLSGNFTDDIILEWTTQVNSHIKRNWKDLQEATEYGATGIAILLAKEFSQCDCIKRSSKGTGFDYWLGKEDELGIFNAKERLEISGILNETPINTVKKRVKEKIDQTKKTVYLEMKANVSVSEFSNPKGEYHIV